MKGNIDDPNAKEELIVKGAKKLLSFGKSLFKSIPIAGTIFDLLDKVADAVYGEFKER